MLPELSPRRIRVKTTSNRLIYKKTVTVKRKLLRFMQISYLVGRATLNLHGGVTRGTINLQLQV